VFRNDDGTDRGGRSGSLGRGEGRGELGVGLGGEGGEVGCLEGVESGAELFVPLRMREKRQHISLKRNEKDS
jgi:hypothetical protein